MSKSFVAKLAVRLKAGLILIFFERQISAHLVDGALRPIETNPIEGEECHHTILVRFWTEMIGTL